MGQLTLRTYKQIRERMVNRVVARTDITDLTTASSIYQVLSAAAREDDDQYFQITKAQDVVDLDRAKGPDLDEHIKIYNPKLIRRLDPSKATGSVVFSRTGTTGVVTIPIGTEVQVPASGATDAIKFVTSETGTILAGNTDSASVAIIAQETGTSFNVDLNTITSFGSKPSGVDSVTNPAALTNGRSRESDEALVSRVKLFLASLSRGTLDALHFAALSTLLSTGERIIFANVVETPSTPGQVLVYVDDGAGTAETTESVTGQTVIASAVGGEKSFFLPQKPVRRESPFTLYRNAGALVEDVDYTMEPTGGKIILSDASFPSGLTAADAITVDAVYYTGLIQEAQKIIDGDAADRVTYPGYRAAGIQARVLSPDIVQLSFSGNITVRSDFNQEDVAAKVSAAVSGYINALGIGEDVILNEIRKRAMNVPGMFDITITEPTTNRVILDSQLARILSGNITIS